MEGLDAIQAKLDKGEELTADETKAVMGSNDNAPSAEADDIDWNNSLKEEQGESTKEKTIEKEDTTSKSSEPKKDNGQDNKALSEQERRQKEYEQRVRDRAEKEKHKAQMREDIEAVSRGEHIDTSGYSLKEKAYFQELIDERRERQKVLEELDVLKLNLAKEKLKKQNDSEGKEELTDDIEDDAFLTKADLKKLLANENKAKEPDQKPNIKQAENYLSPSYMQVCDKITRDKYEDFDEVMECYHDLYGDDRNPHVTKLNNIAAQGGNAVEELYFLIKEDIAFDDVIDNARARIARRQPKSRQQETRPSQEEIEKAQRHKEAEEKEKRVKENLEKTKTSGNYGGASGGSDDELSINDILKMSDRDFAKLPAHKRKALLQKVG